MDAIILGSGASKAYSDSPTNVSMPLATDFFKTLNKLSVKDNGWVLVGKLLEYLRHYHNIGPIDFIEYENDIEQLHSEIQDRLIAAGKSDNFEDRLRCSGAYNELIFIFCAVLNEIQNGEASRFHLNLVDAVKSEDVFITFNWDTLLDRALNIKDRWSTDTGYHVTPKAIYRDEWQRPAVSMDKGNLLLKLHGSTNWLTSYIIYDLRSNTMEFIHDSSPETFYVYESNTQSYPCYDGRYMDGYQDFSMGYYPPNLPEKGKSVEEGHLLASFTPRTPFTPKGDSSKDALVSMPVIIPPVQSKSYEFFGELFRTLWTKAEETLTACDRIVLLGYSFPVTDYQSNDLFLRAFMKRKSIPEVIIVNPYPEQIKNKFLDQFGIPPHKLKVYKEYLDSEYYMDKLFR